MQEASTPASYQVGPNETCLTALMDTVHSSPNVVLYTRPANYEWVNVTGGEFLEEVFAVAKGLVANGIEQGDRIALLSSTRYEWTVLDYAIWAAGAVSVPIYPSSSLAQVQWIVGDSGAVLAITETRDHTSLMEHLVVDESGAPCIKGVTSSLRRVLEINSSALSTLKFEGRQMDDSVIMDRIHATQSSDLASLVYTSGTTGRPKGCILTHRNFLSEARALLTHDIGAIAVPGRRTITFLPLAHVLARSVSLAFAIGGGLQSHWSDFQSIAIQLQRTHPHMVVGVPRVFEKIRIAAQNNAKESGLIATAVFKQAEQTAIDYSKALDTPEGPSTWLKLRLKGFDKLIYSKLRAATGDAVVYGITGGSAMSPNLLHFFRGVGIPVAEGYGLTETVGAALVSFGENTKIGTVGKPLGGVSVRINSDGEILLKGPMVFDGYWNDPDATAASFTDGWYNTGDLGELDDEGFLTVTGRKKDLVVTAGGKNISPAPMEESLREHPLISQALVVGDGKPFVSVLLTLDEDTLRTWKLDHNMPENKTVKDLSSDPQLRAEIQDAINQVNMTVSHAESIKKFHILDSGLTEESNELTPTLKIKRNVVVQKYAKEIDRLYT